MRKPKTASVAETAPTLTGIKGFDANLRCRDFQFEAGKTYTHTGKVQACHGGFHAIIADAHPLAVFNYYAPAGSRYFRVEMSGATHSDYNEKIAAEIIKIGDEIGLNALAAEAVKWVTDRATATEGNHATGDRSASSATGDRSASSATGDRSASSATGDQSASSATGDQSASSATGYQSASSATGDRSASSATGYQSASSATGDRSASSATGYQSASLTTGSESTSAALGEHGAAVSTGHKSCVKGLDGNALFAAERETWNGPIISVACGIVGQDGIEPDTWYACKDGKLVRAIGGRA